MELKKKLLFEADITVQKYYEKAWSVMKEVIGKMHQHNKSKRPCRLNVDNKCITLETEIGKKFNEFFHKNWFITAKKDSYSK